MFSSTTTELSIRRENASASPPNTMLLMEPPPSESRMTAVRAERGIEKNTASVARMLPRNTRIMMEVRNSPIAPSCTSVSMAVFDEHRLIEDHLRHQVLRNVEQVLQGFAG